MNNLSVTQVINVIIRDEPDIRPLYQTMYPTGYLVCKISDHLSGIRPVTKLSFWHQGRISSLYVYPFRPNAKYCSLCTFVSGLHGSPRWFQADGVVFRFFIKATSLTIFNTFFIFIPCIFGFFVCCCRFVQGNIFKIKFLFQTYVPGIFIFFLNSFRKSGLVDQNGNGKKGGKEVK